MEKKKQKLMLILVWLALEEIKSASGKLTSQFESTWSMQVKILTYIMATMREQIY